MNTCDNIPTSHPLYPVLLELCEFTKYLSSKTNEFTTNVANKVKGIFNFATKEKKHNTVDLRNYVLDSIPELKNLYINNFNKNTYVHLDTVFILGGEDKITPKLDSIFGGEDIKSNLKIEYANNIDNSVITEDIENLLYDILSNSKINRVIIITSLFRTPIKQVKAMIYNINKLGVTSQLMLYGNKGDKVIKYYIEIKHKYTYDEICIKLVEKMREINFLSSHMDWKERGGIDFGKISNQFNKKEYSNDIKNIVKEAKKSKFIYPNSIFEPGTKKGENALHIEIRLKQIKN